MPNKRSFFERLTGAVRLDEEKDEPEPRSGREAISKSNIFEEKEEEAQLTVDVYHTPSEIIIKTMVAGVKPDDLDVSITRDSVTIRGKRSEDRTISDDEYFHRELYWGSFARVIGLPEEIDVDGAEAVEKHGMLVLHLPKLDKNR
ncbi:MAG: Hsp20/alpha crystallin family protein, partial [Parcubacteria group bacterium]